MKKQFLSILLAFLVTFAFAETSQKKFVASTSWTASFADIAGVDNVESIAPANLRHPPEYEITVSDIQKIMQSDYFVYAGFERMMQTLGSSVKNVQMIQIACDNSIKTVTESTRKIAEAAGTQKENEARLSEYVSFIKDSAARIEKAGLKGAKVLVNKNQRFLAAELGFDISATFGPGPVTSEQILDAQNGGYVFIIDNVHNPVGAPLREVAPDAKYIVWRNFPEKVEHNALLNTIKENIKTLEDSIMSAEQVSSTNTFKMSGLLKNSSATFKASEVYEREGVYFVDMKEIVPANLKRFKKNNKIKRGDIFLDTSNKIVMFLGDGTFNVMKGTKLGSIKDIESFKKILSDKNSSITFEN